jgi:hypothetical protein
VLVQYGLAAVLGLITRLILGVAQSRVLRGYVDKAGWWLAANAVARALGKVLIFMGMDLVPWPGAPAIAEAA